MLRAGPQHRSDGFALSRQQDRVRGIRRIPVPTADEVDIRLSAGVPRAALVVVTESVGAEYLEQPGTCRGGEPRLGQPGVAHRDRVVGFESA
jgi:hypothetical protein